jgi:hypothetical protein
MIGSRKFHECQEFFQRGKHIAQKGVSREGAWRDINGCRISSALERVMGLFFRSEVPGPVFSATYPRGSFAPDPFPSTSSGLRSFGFQGGA